MKRIIAGILFAVTAFSLFACNSETNGATDNNTSMSVSTTVRNETENDTATTVIETLTSSGIQTTTKPDETTATSSNTTTTSEVITTTVAKKTTTTTKKTTTKMPTTTTTKKTTTTTNVPSYVAAEAARVAKNVYAKQNANTFSFLAISDAHYLVGNTDIENSVLHAGQGMGLVRNAVDIDFGVVLGDNGWGAGASGSSANRATIEMGIAEIKSTNKCIDESLSGIPNLRAVGNHDSLIYNYSFNENKYITSFELYQLYGAYNSGAVFQSGNQERGYCYRDFEEWKLRVICLNTSDIQDITPSDSARPVAVSATQAKWFAKTLDMSSKSDASEWSILILSHAPLDWGRACIYLCDILKAYLDGTTCNAVTHDGVTITYNYSGKNSATIIGNIHGHNHNYKVDNLRRLVSGTTTEPIDIKRICIPNACFDRSNERGENGAVDVYDIEYGESTTYRKVAGTGKDTAFCVVTIDTVARKIYADAYGAGYDRVISY